MEIKNVINVQFGENKSRFAVNGVSNKEMIPMLKAVIDNNDIGGLLELKRGYPTVLKSSLKYIGKKRRAKIKELLAQELLKAV